MISAISIPAYSLIKETKRIMAYTGQGGVNAAVLGRLASGNNKLDFNLLLTLPT
jgi:hypothetical protein